MASEVGVRIVLSAPTALKQEIAKDLEPLPLEATGPFCEAIAFLKDTSNVPLYQTFLQSREVSLLSSHSKAAKNVCRVLFGSDIFDVEDKVLPKRVAPFETKDNWRAFKARLIDSSIATQNPIPLIDTQSKTLKLSTEYTKKLKDDETDLLEYLFLMYDLNEFDYDELVSLLHDISTTAEFLEKHFPDPTTSFITDDTWTSFLKDLDAKIFQDASDQPIERTFSDPIAPVTPAPSPSGPKEDDSGIASD